MNHNVEKLKSTLQLAYKKIKTTKAVESEFSPIKMSILDSSTPKSAMKNQTHTIALAALPTLSDFNDTKMHKQFKILKDSQKHKSSKIKATHAMKSLDTLVRIKNRKIMDLELTLPSSLDSSYTIFSDGTMSPLTTQSSSSSLVQDSPLASKSQLHVYTKHVK